MVKWHYRLNGHKFEQAPGDSEGQGSLACCSPRAPGDSEGQGSLACCSPWGPKELDTT